MKIRNLMLLFSMVFGFISPHLMAMEEDPIGENSKETIKKKRQSRIIQACSNFIAKQKPQPLVFTNETDLSAAQHNKVEEKLGTGQQANEDRNEKLKNKSAKLFKILSSYEVSFSAINEILVKYPEVLDIMNDKDQSPESLAEWREMPLLSFALKSQKNWINSYKNKDNKTALQNERQSMRERIIARGATGDRNQALNY